MALPQLSPYVVRDATGSKSFFRTFTNALTYKHWIEGQEKKPATLEREDGAVWDEGMEDWVRPSH